MEQKKYWQNLGELNDTEGHQKLVKDEFQEDLPFSDDGKGLLDAKAPRRDFLKYLGFSTAAAALAASCETPVRKSIPYLNKPENLTPGVAEYFATTYVREGDSLPVLAKVRDGRPIKIEGNELSALTGRKGGTSAQAQASVLGIYDVARLRYPAEIVNGELKEFPGSGFEGVDRKIPGELNGPATVLLTSSIHSPTTRQVISEFLAKNPGSRHVQYDAISYSAMLQANEACYGKRAIPSYHFEKAKTIVSIEADFLGTWLNFVEYAGQYAQGRKLNMKSPEMSKHIHFEGSLSLTGANADDRFLHRPSETGAVVLNLLAKLGGNVSAPAIGDEKLRKGIDMAVAALGANKGAALVVCGSNDINIQIVVNAINEAIGANGTTIDWSAPLQIRQGTDEEMAQLVRDMNDGKVDGLLIYEANPAYNYHNAEGFKSGLKKVKVSVSFNDKLDETTALCKYVIPHHHYLESWGDAEPKTGYISMLQPTIAPLFRTRYFQTSLLKWTGNNSDYETYFKNYWLTKLGSQEAFDKTLQDGVIEPAAETISATAFNGASLTDAAAKVIAMKPGSKTELVLYQKVSIGSGADSNNPWLQEMPDPITKATWDNYVMIPYTLADELGIKLDDVYEMNPPKPVIILTINGKELKLPILAIPGMHPNVVAVALGYGRTDKLGVAAGGVGQNVYPFVNGAGGTREYYVSSVEYKKTDTTYPIAYTQTHNQYEGRVEAVREFSLNDFKKDPEVIPQYREELAEEFAKETGEYRTESTLYPNYESPGAHWGMSIDLNSCIGCGACTIACTAENNVPVVGKYEVARNHEMHWLRIDRYFAVYRGKSDGDDLNVIFMPMLCQHCDNAPCENVCPVAATNHSSEGLNQMAYNRCIGTRYCANNCPFKVRRFNWADYTGADSFPDNQKPLVGDGQMEPVVLMMNDDLSRMVLNPDVTVRSRGVMEKCSFCVQRLQDAKLHAKKAQDPTLIRDVKTACMQACPTQAIVFGNVNDKQSMVYKIRHEEQVERTFYALEQLHVLPNINYLAKVRNTERPVGVKDKFHKEPAAEAKPRAHS